MDLLGLLFDLFSLGRSPDYPKPTLISKVTIWLLFFGLLFLGFTANYHPVSLLYFGLYCLAAMLMACGVAYALFRMNIMGGYRPSEFGLFVTAMAVWFVGAALWFVG
ncbi:hypothetical protein [Hymenobacter metallilatus]|uniref:Uncharacterized protein n=1 Tax=Hymenobacter metallilatus TaxID=2493666 RepID=A0A3R9MW07_9BACT|nr:hypothetical protein [Hymenobacter metallilatus]RSK31738.1 hypothetical protein EI290_12980 [Hymenobacter metallilatus]